MDVYRQATDIIRIVREGNGTAKALCLRKEMQKKRQTYAVVCETLRHYELLEDVLAVAEFFKYYPQANKEFALCMTYDIVLGKGISTKMDSTARAVQESSSFLREAYWQVYKHHTIPPRTNDKIEEGDENSGGVKLPRYARVNTLKVETDVLVERLRRSAEKRTHDEAEGTAEERKPSKKGRKILPDFTLDPIVPSLLVFPPGTDLHAHPSVRSGQVVLQDRASCLPACVLLDAVKVVKPFPAAKDGSEKPLEYIIDACAAPGNKTTQMAAIGAPHVKIMATERDERRSKLLERRVQTLGASDYVNVVNMDFFQLSSDDRAATEGILLDPSCSASGVVSRVDVAVMQHRQKQQADARKEQASSPAAAAASAEDAEYDDAQGAVNPDEHGNQFSSNEGRIEKLARLQRKLLAHSLLSFDNCRRVVYSTCSVHEEENEGVVREVLNDPRVQARGWQLSNIMPDVWSTRGIKTDSDTMPLDFTIRCDPQTDATNGFYVACFDRVITAPVAAAAETKEKEIKKENKKGQEPAPTTSAVVALDNDDDDSDSD